ncbi:MAG: CoA transferase subunit A [Lachnospiraceae bacterium]|nr:CoA transferase subunit A [Lachnospiraceae bacterium]MBQ1400239.1 CoA transferase subunit A [Lachnospiraceae bacterium]MBQ1515709.1 CoA transferase subunit A [Lachnospiraceae bacterium]MBQ4309368.1 CoA transferase subunit A [Lachnospiraceae bacterium]MBQ9464446.1 CoA transferase subunit A [Lachnospiraceae bacterium]
MAINKVITADEAVAGVEDGMTIMVGGFLATGSPEILMDALVRKGVKHLTVIANDGGLAEGQPAIGPGKTARGVGKLLENHMVDHIIASHLGVNPRLNEQFAAGTLTYTLVPQGTLAEKIRASAYGLGGVITPTGVGTPMEFEKDELGRDKITIEIDGKKYLLERPLHADYAFVRASVCDHFGNFMCRKTTKNFNYPMAGAADHTIVAAEQVVNIGEVDPDMFDISGVLVDYVVEGEPKWQI